LLIDSEEVTDAYMQAALASAKPIVDPNAGSDSGKSGKGGKGGKKRLASPMRGAASGAIGARRTGSAAPPAPKARSTDSSAGGSSTGRGTDAERLRNVLLGGGTGMDHGEDPGLDCRAIIHIVKQCHSNIIDISFVWHCL
jgi:hypothetical protein